jgi:hypothetical protein
MTRIWVLSLVLMGCSSDGEKEALKLANDLATEGVAKIEAAFKAGRPVDGIFECVANAMNETLMKAGGAYAELATKLGRLCDHDVPLAAIAKSVEEIEAARAKKPADTMLTECMVNDVSFAMKSLKNRDEAKPLLARYAIACPGEKLDY